MAFRLVKVPSYYKFNPRNIVKNPDIFTKKEKVLNSRGELVERRAFSSDGLFSERIFGAFEAYETYSCLCGHTTGKGFNGVFCKKCSSEVEFVESHMDRCGWIDISGDKYDEDGNITEKGKGWKIIDYLHYQNLEKVIGVENLSKIISFSSDIVVDGDLDLDKLEELRAEEPKQKYWFIGITEFEKNYFEVLDYYFELNKGKHSKIYEELLDPSEIFIDKIIVPTTLIRPAMRCEEGLKLDEMNTIYINMIKSNEVLNNKIIDLDLMQRVSLLEIQAQYAQIMEIIVNLLRHKTGHFRYHMIGTRINFIARNIIVPDETGMLASDEVAVPYLTFLVLYKFEIINIISQLKNIELNEAQVIHFKATLEFNNEVYNIMMKMVNEEDCSILLNRNPTIAIGSMLCMKIKTIKKDVSDFTLSLNNNILSLMNADFDGDVLNITSLKDRHMKQLFRRTLSPKSLLIDSNNGKINKKLIPEREYITGLSALLSPLK